MLPLIDTAGLEVEYDPRAGKFTAVLTVGGDVTFREAPELREHLFEAIAAHPERNLVVELSGVDRFDTAAMAVLLEGMKVSRKTGPEIFLVGANDAVTKVFRLAGFEEALLRCFGCLDDVRQQLTN